MTIIFPFLTDNQIQNKTILSLFTYSVCDEKVKKLKIIFKNNFHTVVIFLKIILNRFLIKKYIIYSTRPFLRISANGLITLRLHVREFI